MKAILLLSLLVSTTTFKLAPRQQPQHNNLAPRQQILQFPAELSLDNYVMFDPDFSEVEDELSVCTWIRKYVDSSAPHVFFSYATTRDSNEIALPDDLTYINANTQSNVEVLEANKWYHYCFTLDTAKLKLDVIINAEQVVELPIPAGSTIESGGTLVLGQEQDSVGGGFDISQTFAGELYQMNVFKKQLNAEEISALSRSRCSDSTTLSMLHDILQDDVVLSWEDILSQQKHGNVNVVERNCRYIGNEVE